MIDAIIFDMDGVIADTEFYHFQLLIDFMKAEGGPTEPAQLYSLVGKSYSNFFANLNELLDNRYSLTEIEKRYHAFEATLEHDIDYLSIFRQDIVHILDYADQNAIKLAVASSSRLEVIHHILSVCGIKDRFEAIVSGEFFAESKPHPEIYLHTMETLNVDPSRCIAIEDSYSGIQAARTAGMSVIAYEETRLGVDQSHAHTSGKDMLSILEIIKHWGN